MDKIILGLLMFRGLTIYELRSFIETNFTSICSNSTGSIQAAIKRLREKNMVIYHEFIDNSINKKVYEITAEGKKFFMTWVQTSMLSGKEKNMELSKLFFMGFVPEEERGSLIDAYIEDLRQERDNLEKIKSASKDSEEKKVKYLAYLEEIGNIDSAESRLRTQKKLDDILIFELATLQLSIDKIDFEIHWFEQFKDKLG